MVGDSESTASTGVKSRLHSLTRGLRVKPETVVISFREGHSDLILTFGIPVQERLNFNFGRFVARVIATKGPTRSRKSARIFTNGYAQDWHAGRQILITVSISIPRA
jgi:hypothetical protein